MPKETRFSRLGILLTALALLQLGLLAFQARQIHELSDEVSDLQKSVGGRGRGGSGGKGDPLIALGRQIEDQSQATQRVQKAIDEMNERTAELEKSAEKVHAKLQEAAAGGALAGAGDGSSPEALKELVESAVQKGLKDHKTWNEEKKPTLTELKATLELNPQQERSLKEVVDAGKQEAYDLTLASRPDGTNKLDDFVAALKAPNPTEASMQAWASLATEKVPGRSTTYLEEIVKVQESVKGQLQRQLSSDQFGKFEQLQVDVLEIKTGFDPFEKYVLEHLGK